MKSKSSLLTNQQSECLYHLVRGRPIREIAKQMDLSPRTVEHYLEAVKSKLNCKTRSELIEKALQMPFIKTRLQLI